MERISAHNLATIPASTPSVTIVCPQPIASDSDCITLFLWKKEKQFLISLMTCVTQEAKDCLLSLYRLSLPKI